MQVLGALGPTDFANGHGDAGGVTALDWEPQVEVSVSARSPGLLPRTESAMSMGELCLGLLKFSSEPRFEPEPSGKCGVHDIPR